MKAHRLIATISAIVLFLGAAIESGQAEEVAKPNIVYILADDLGIGDLGCYGQRKIKTPALDLLASNGMRFTQHYAGSTICAPSRCALLTGLHTGHCRIRSNARETLQQEDVTIAKLLKQGGYTTACIGKWGLGGADSPGAPWHQGFDYFYGYLNQGHAHRYYPRFLWRNNEKVELPGNDPKKRIGQYSHDLLTSEALTFVKQNSGQPFFLYLAYTIPHAENTVPEDSLSQYLGKFPEQSYSSSHYGYTKHPRASYAAMVSRMDRDIGRLIELLQQLQIDRRTIVMFSSDNGPSSQCGPTIDFFNSNAGYRGIKRDLYEGGIRVPLIAWWPGQIEAGLTSDHLSAHWDVLPTMLDIAGMAASKGTDGISFLPTLFGQPNQQDHHAYLYWEFHESERVQAVRIGDWKGLRTLKGRGYPQTHVELYDLAHDVTEKHDIASENSEIVQRMEETMGIEQVR